MIRDGYSASSARKESVSMVESDLILVFVGSGRLRDPSEGPQGGSHLLLFF